MKRASTVHFWTMPPELFHEKIPFPVSSIIEELKRRRAETVEGIFRLSGADKTVEALIEELDRGDVENWGKYGDIHVLTVTLKRYFRTLSQMEPLVPAECVEALTALTDLQNVSQQVEFAKNLFGEVMSPVRRRILMYVLDYFRVLANSSTSNLMDTKSLAASISSSIVGQRSTASFANAERATQVIEFLIAHFSEVFPDYELDRAWLCTSEDIQEAKAVPPNVANVEQQILKASLRKNHLIPYVPACRYSQKPMYKRPTRPPPPRPGNDKDAVLNMFDSLIQRVSARDSRVIGMLKGARNSVMGIPVTNV